MQEVVLIDKLSGEHGKEQERDSRNCKAFRPIVQSYLVDRSAFHRYTYNIYSSDMHQDRMLKPASTGH